ncbi:acyl-CoA dehydrogenase family protein [Streptomyces hundungensis]
MTAPQHKPKVSEREARQVAEAAREQDWRKPSFAKELFLGRLRLDLIHPHPQPAPEDVERGEAFLAKMRDFCETRVDGRLIERESKIPDEVVNGLKELGALGMKIDTKYGGQGLTQVYYNKALALAGSASPAIGALLSAHQSIGVPQPLKLFGTQEQKDTFLPRCARTDISAFLLTEPDVGSDPARLATAAVPDGEDAYVLDGVKLWTTNGVVADLLVVMARVPKSEGHKGGITAFVVEADSPGVTVENRNAFMGLRGIENGVTRFHQVRVPAANRIGPEGSGLKIALTTLNTGRLSLPAMCVGSGKWCLKIAREWAGAREQWGRPVARHEAVGAKISFIAATTFALEAMTDLSAQMADEDRNDIRIEAALAKLYGSEMGWLITDELVQIRGGRGFETADSLAARGERAVPAEQMLRDMRINRIFEGSTEIMHLLIAREAVDAHLSVAGDLIDPDKTLQDKAKAGVGAAGFYAKWLPTGEHGQGDHDEDANLADHHHAPVEERSDGGSDGGEDRDEPAHPVQRGNRAHLHDAPDRRFDRQVGGFEQTVGEGVDHFDGDRGQGDGAEGEDHAGCCAGECLGQGLAVAFHRGADQLGAEGCDEDDQADRQQQLVVGPKPACVEIDAGGGVDGLGGEIGCCGGEFAGGLGHPVADDLARIGGEVDRALGGAGEAAHFLGEGYIAETHGELVSFRVSGAGHCVTLGAMAARVQSWPGRHWTARVTARSSAPAPPSFQAICCLPLTVTT